MPSSSIPASGLDLIVIPGTPLLVTRAEEASLVKNASNVFIALRLTFANEVGPGSAVEERSGRGRCGDRH